MTAKTLSDLLWKHCIGIVELREEDKNVEVVVRTFKSNAGEEWIEIVDYKKENHEDVQLEDSLEDIIITDLIFHHTAWSFPATENGIHLFSTEIDNKCEGAIRMFEDPFAYQLELLEKLIDELILLKIKFGGILQEYEYQFKSNDVYLKERQWCDSEPWIIYYNSSLCSEVSFYQDLFTGELLFFTSAGNYVSIERLSEETFRKSIENLIETALYRDSRS